MSGHVPLSVVLAVVAVALPLAMAWAGRGRRRRQRQPAPSERGLGAALALALDGDLTAASAAIRRGVEVGGLRPDHVVAWVAVARAAGRSAQAARMVEGLAGARAPTPRWLSAIQVRLALDLGEVDRAARLAERRPDLPADLRVAALARAGRWTAARGLWREAHGRRGDAAAAACLDAGVAAECWSEEPPRAARRALKRALSYDPTPLAALAVAAVVAVEPTEAAEWHTRLTTALSEGGSLAGPASILSEDSVLVEARGLFDSGEVEAALGCLRTHLDERPEDRVVRQQYAEWLCEHGEPADWRAELRAWSELEAPLRATRFRCGRCSLIAADAWVICPRCDALAAPVPVDPAAPVTASVGQGSRLSDLQVLATGPDGPAAG